MRLKGCMYLGAACWYLCMTSVADVKVGFTTSQGRDCARSPDVFEMFLALLLRMRSSLGPALWSTSGSWGKRFVKLPRSCEHELPIGDFQIITPRKPVITCPFSVP